MRDSHHSVLAGLLPGPVLGEVDGGQQDVVVRHNDCPVQAVRLVRASHNVWVGQPCLKAHARLSLTSGSLDGSASN